PRPVPHYDAIPQITAFPGCLHRLCGDYANLSQVIVQEYALRVLLAAQAPEPVPIRIKAAQLGGIQEVDLAPVRPPALVQEYGLGVAEKGLVVGIRRLVNRDRDR